MNLFMDISELPKGADASRAWARENYKPFDPITGVWHPVVQAECVRMNIEAGMTFGQNADTQDAVMAPALKARMDEVATLLAKALGDG